MITPLLRTYVREKHTTETRARLAYVRNGVIMRNHHINTMKTTWLAVIIGVIIGVITRNHEKTSKMTYWQGKFDMHEIDTTPGAAGPFAPPPGWIGSSDAYRDILRERYRHDTAARQQMGIVGMLQAMVTFSGLFAAEARAIAEAIGGRGMEA